MWLGMGGHWSIPTVEYIAQRSDVLELRVTYHSWSIAVFWCDYRLGDMMVEEFQGVGDLLSLGYLVDDLLETIVFQRRADIPTILATKIPRVAHTGLFVNGDPTAKWSNRCGTLVLGSIEKLPS